MLTKVLKTTIEPQFRMEEDDGGISAAVDLLDPIDESGGDGGGDPEPELASAPSATPAFNFDYDKLAASVASAVQPRAAEKQITAEEAAKLLNFWEPGDDWFQQFDNLDTRRAAVVSMRDGLARQFVTIMQHMLQDHGQTIRGEFDPVRSFVLQQQGEQRAARFNTSYPQLANEAMSPIIDAVIGALVKDPAFKQKPEAEQFKAIAAGVEAVIKSQNPAFVLNKPAGNGAKKPGHAIPVTSPGGGGGGAGGGKATASGTTKPKAVTLLG